MGGLRGLLAAAVAALVLAPVAAADDWWPHPSDAEWVYSWTDTQYNTSPTAEKVTVKDQKGKAFTLHWDTKDQGNSGDAVASVGDMAFQESTFGLLNTDWSSSPPPPDMPILCAQLAQCPNALSSTLYNVIWGSRSPVLAEPLLQGASWTSTGGAQGDVASSSTYQGHEVVKVPAFPDGVEAAKVQTEITQAGALGDPYGSGVRTVWWAYGVGPVKVTFEHSGGTDAPSTNAELKSTNQTPKPPPDDTNYFPLTKGTKLVYRWKNTKYLKKPSVQVATIDEVQSMSARISVKDRSGPVRVAGAYGYTLRLDGLTNIWGLTKAATFAKFPALGPKALPQAKRRHFFTPFDLLNFGMNPILPAYPSTGNSWSTKNPSRDFAVFGVNGTTTILGIQRVKVPAGTFNALAVRSTLNQPGFKFGSGTRTAWFAPGKGLVKLVFRHADRSVSTVELLAK
jgi:hypothetical protein